MHVVVVMLVVGSMAGVSAEGILSGTLVVEYFMNQAFVQKGFEGSVNRHSVKLIRELRLDVAVRQGKLVRKQYAEYLLSAVGLAKVKAFECRSSSTHAVSRVGVCDN